MKTLQEQGYTFENVQPAKTTAQEEAEAAWTKLEQLREKYDTSVSAFEHVTLNDLEKSARLRSIILDFNFKFFFNEGKPKGSFQRTYKNKREEQIANTQAYAQSSIHLNQVSQEEAANETRRVIKEFREGEEGYDYVYHRDGTRLATQVDVKKLEAEIIEELRQYAKKDPMLAMEAR